jgi:hypothetical protein
MKAISTLVSLILIITTFATSAVLYLNGNYTLSAALCIVWMASLTLWINFAGINLINHNERTHQNA